jgi:Bacterial cell division membrane protein
LAVSLVAMEPDFATAVFHLFLALFILLAIGVPWRRLIAIGVFSLLIATSLQGLYLSRFGHVFERFRAFFAGEDGVYQVLRAKEAILAGGLFGQGPGATMPYVPYAYNDMAFAALAFALGWLGVTLLFLAYSIIFFRGMQIAVRLEGGLSVVALGVTAMVTLQAAVHTAVVLGMLPVTGMPLPLVSYGGTSLVASGLALGVLHAAARAAFAGPKPAKRRRVA